MGERMQGDFDFAVVGGGLVGAAIAYGLVREGRRVVILDEGDMAVRASRGNFALVWVQSKGLGMPAYADWTAAGAGLWPELAAALKAETSLDVALQQPGGFHLCLSDLEMERRQALLQRMHNQAPTSGYRAEMVSRAEILSALPDIGPDVVGGSYCPLDGHVNSLRLFRSLHTALRNRGADYRPGASVETIDHRNGGFELTTERGTVRAERVVLAAGNANMRLAPMVGLSAPMKPERGQIIVTERLQPFLHHPVVTLRQTDEGTVMIGDSKEEGVDPAGQNLEINSVMAARAIRMFPLLGQVNIVRTWRAIRVMPQDGFPIYDQSVTHPGAFLVTCHSGVTLAGIHALRLAPMIAGGKLDPAQVGAFSARRFDALLTTGAAA